MRYWRTRFELNRCDPSTAEVRRVDQGGQPIADWRGPPWAPPEVAHLYAKEANGKWWPRFEGTPYTPCRACATNAPGATPKEPATSHVAAALGTNLIGTAGQNEAPCRAKPLGTERPVGTK